MVIPGGGTATQTMTPVSQALRGKAFYHERPIQLVVSLQSKST